MTTAEDLAHELGVTGRALRGWLRSNRPHRHGDRWLFSAEEAEAVRRDYRAASRSRLVTPTLRPSPQPVGAGQRSSSDEHYVIDLCAEVLGEEPSRQHRFEWLRGDQNERGRSVRLPVDAYFANRNVVVEYRERQHFESVAHFDKPDRTTVSGVHRGEQRRIYDERREVEIPQHGIRLVIVAYSDLGHDQRGRLLRTTDADMAVLAKLLS